MWAELWLLQNCKMWWSAEDPGTVQRWILFIIYEFSGPNQRAKSNHHPIGSPVDVWYFLLGEAPLAERWKTSNSCSTETQPQAHDTGHRRHAFCCRLELGGSKFPKQVGPEDSYGATLKSWPIEMRLSLGPPPTESLVLWSSLQLYKTPYTSHSPFPPREPEAQRDHTTSWGLRAT